MRICTKRMGLPSGCWGEHFVINVIYEGNLLVNFVKKKLKQCYQQISKDYKMLNSAKH